MTTKKTDFSDSRYKGLEHAHTIGVVDAKERAGKLTVTFLKDLAPELDHDQAQHRLIVEGEDMVRTFAGTVSGAHMVLDVETVPTTCAALVAAIGKNVSFFRLS